MKCANPECFNSLKSFHDFICSECKTTIYCSEKCLRSDRSFSFPPFCSITIKNSQKHKSECKASKFIKLASMNHRSLNDFEYLKSEFGQEITLGKGSFSEVKLVKEINSNEKFAMKIINKKSLKSQSDIDHLLREINIHQKLFHPNIIRLHYSFETTDNVYLVQEYAPTCLATYLKKHKKCHEGNAFTIFFQVCLAVDFLHKCKIIHRDIKPENILIDANGNIKLCDFGWCGKLEDSRTTFCGTLDYLAPEIAEQTKQDEKVDIWCLGTLLFELVNGFSPFLARNLSEKLLQFKNLRLLFSEETPLSPDIKKLIRGMLQKAPEDRPSMSEIFADKWMTKNAQRTQIDIQKYMELSKNSLMTQSTFRMTSMEDQGGLEKTGNQALFSRSREIISINREVPSINREVTSINREVASINREVTSINRESSLQIARMEKESCIKIKIPNLTSAQEVNSLTEIKDSSRILEHESLTESKSEISFKKLLAFKYNVQENPLSPPKFESLESIPAIRGGSKQLSIISIPENAKLKALLKEDLEDQSPELPNVLTQLEDLDHDLKLTKKKKKTIMNIGNGSEFPLVTKVSEEQIYAFDTDKISKLLGKSSFEMIAEKEESETLQTKASKTSDKKKGKTSKKGKKGKKKGKTKAKGDVEAKSDIKLSLEAIKDKSQKYQTFDKNDENVLNQSDYIKKKLISKKEVPEVFFLGLLHISELFSKEPSFFQKIAMIFGCLSVKK